MVNYKNFEVKHSIKKEDAVTLGICAQCLEDIKDINNRRYKYPRMLNMFSGELLPRIC